MLLVSSCVSVITWLCNRAMRFKLRPKNWPLHTKESPVAQWLEHLTRSRRVVGSHPIWGSDFFRVLLVLIAFISFKFESQNNSSSNWYLPIPSRKASTNFCTIFHFFLPYRMPSNVPNVADGQPYEIERGHAASKPND